MKRRGRPPKPAETTPGSLAELLQNERTSRGLDFEAWAKLLGVNGTTVQRWEHGRSRPTIEQLRRLVKVGVEARQLLTRT